MNAPKDKCPRRKVPKLRKSLKKLAKVHTYNQMKQTKTPQELYSICFCCLYGTYLYMPVTGTKAPPEGNINSIKHDTDAAINI